MSLLVAVGTYIRGFDELVEAADRAACHLALGGFAQIGHSAYLPHTLRWQRFLPPGELQARIAAARVVVCHGGVGILGEAMRAGRPIVALPRRGATGRRNPAGDQSVFLERLAGLFPLRIAGNPEELEQAIAMLLAGPRSIDYRLGSDIPRLIGGFLRGGCCMREHDDGSCPVEGPVESVNERERPRGAGSGRE
ncbi:hypothetical protein SH611_10745 [Geminicoccaceae bacterium 1502E]|nr:hypothetical protein [Geminicoccaceae bacterium 1502E]